MERENIIVSYFRKNYEMLITKKNTERERVSEFNQTGGEILHPTSQISSITTQSITCSLSKGKTK